MLGHCMRRWCAALSTLSVALLQFEPVTGDMEGERKKALEILDKIQSKQPVLDVNKVRACDAGDWGGRWVSCAC